MKTRISLALVTCFSAAALYLSGCLPFPLGDAQKSRIDPALEGYWLSDRGEQVTLVSLYPFDDHAYVLESRDLKRDGSRFDFQSRFLAKAWLTDVKGRTFLTVEPLVQRLAGYKDPKFYPLFRLVREGTRIETRRVNEEFAPLKSVKSAAEVAAVIDKELDNPGLYAADLATYRHLDLETDKDLIGSLSGEPR